MNVATRIAPNEELRRLKSAIALATESATEEQTPNRRARAFVATLSGAVSNIYGDVEGDKLFNLLKDRT